MSELHIVDLSLAKDATEEGNSGKSGKGISNLFEKSLF
jgi:hypothetical protein